MNAALRHEISGDLRHAPWGTAMGWHFAIADALWDRGEYVPAHWQYHPALGGIETDTYESETIAEFLDREIVTVADLVHAGNVLSRYEDMLTLYGRDY